MSLRFRDLQQGRYYETTVSGETMPFLVKSKVQDGRDKFHFQIDTPKHQWLALRYNPNARYRLSTKDRFNRAGTKIKL